MMKRIFLGSLALVSMVAFIGCKDSVKEVKQVNQCINANLQDVTIDVVLSTCIGLQGKNEIICVNDTENTNYYVEYMEKVAPGVTVRSTIIYNLDGDPIYQKDEPLSRINIGVCENGKVVDEDGKVYNIGSLSLHDGDTLEITYNTMGTFDTSDDTIIGMEVIE